MKKRILLVGGGSGGHVFPLVAVADALKNKSLELGASLEIMVLGEGQFLKRAADENHLKSKSIMAGKFRRYFSFKNLLDLFKFPVGFIQSLWHIFWFMPDAVFAKGGYSSVSPGIAAKIYFIPLFIHESDSIPGMANKFLGKISKKVFLAFNDGSRFFNSKKVLLVGNPVRKGVLSGGKGEGINFFNFSSGKKIILTMGGSQGARVINNIIIESLAILARDYQIIHQCGASQLKITKDEVDRLIKEGGESYGRNIENNYRLYPFLNFNELKQAYAASDIIISRAGANNLFEIAELGKPAIIIPIKNSSADHQSLNAQEIGKFGAEIIEEQNLTSHILLNIIESFNDNDKYQEASRKIKEFATPDAADKIAEELLNT